jgi:hypothetical protein
MFVSMKAATGIRGLTSGALGQVQLARFQQADQAQPLLHAGFGSLLPDDPGSGNAGAPLELTARADFKPGSAWSNPETPHTRCW